MSADDDMPASLRDMLMNESQDFFDDNSRLRGDLKLSQSEVSNREDDKWSGVLAPVLSLG